MEFSAAPSHTQIEKRAQTPQARLAPAARAHTLSNAQGSGRVEQWGWFRDLSGVAAGFDLLHAGLDLPYCCCPTATPQSSKGFEASDINFMFWQASRATTAQGQAVTQDSTYPAPMSSASGSRANPNPKQAAEVKFCVCG